MGREGVEDTVHQEERSKRKLIATFRDMYGRGHCCTCVEGERNSEMERQRGEEEGRGAGKTERKRGRKKGDEHGFP